MKKLIILSILYFLTHAISASAISDQEQQIRDIVKKYLLEQPEIIVEAIDALKTKQINQKSQSRQQVIITQHAQLVNSPHDLVLGNKDGGVTLVFFSDYSCGYCKSNWPIVQDLIKGDHDLRVVIKEIPILGQISMLAARMTLAAEKQGKYAQLHNALMQYKGKLSEEIIIRQAKLQGLDIDKLNTDMQSTAIDNIIQDNFALAQALQIEGTPVFVIGNEFIEQFANYKLLANAIKNARENKIQP